MVTLGTLRKVSRCELVRLRVPHSIDHVDQQLEPLFAGLQVLSMDDIPAINQVKNVPGVVFGGLGNTPRPSLLNKPYIQSILPHGLSMPKVPRGDQV